jgi:hypothetical protein
VWGIGLGGGGGAVVVDEGAADPLAGGVAVAFMCGRSFVSVTAEALAFGSGGALMWSGSGSVPLTECGSFAQASSDIPKPTSAMPCVSNVRRDRRWERMMAASYPEPLARRRDSRRASVRRGTLGRFNFAISETRRTSRLSG